MNIELGKKVLKQITDHPETHDQSSWSNACGTAMCIAGHAIVLAGGSFDTKGQFFCDKDGQFIDSESAAAQELLEISREDATRLFFNAATPEAPSLLANLIAEAEEKL